MASSLENLFRTPAAITCRVAVAVTHRTGRYSNDWELVLAADAIRMQAGIACVHSFNNEPEEQSETMSVHDGKMLWTVHNPESDKVHVIRVSHARLQTSHFIQNPLVGAGCLGNPLSQFSRIDELFNLTEQTPSQLDGIRTRLFEGSKSSQYRERLIADIAKVFGRDSATTLVTGRSIDRLRIQIGSDGIVREALTLDAEGMTTGSLRVSHISVLKQEPTFCFEMPSSERLERFDDLDLIQ